MSKLITSSVWNSDYLPEGISFNKAEGVFSGSPNVEAGEYIVPVSVFTNYGSDKKDVSLLVEGKNFPVYAVGAMAAQWSDNAIPDDYGFRLLPIPHAQKLSSIPAGFAAYSGKGKWVIGSKISQSIYGTPGVSYLSPREFPIDGVLHITGGVDYTGNAVYFAYQTRELAVLCSATYSSSNGYYQPATSEGAVLPDVLKFQENFSHGITYSTKDGNFCLGGAKYVPVDEVVHFAPLVSSAASLSVFYITRDGSLFEVGTNTKGQHVRRLEQAGKIKNVWTHEAELDVFVLTHDNYLFARGNNYSYMLGLPEKKSYSDFELVGQFDVKKIESNFLLTHDGKLFHTGTLNTNGITEPHSAFSQVFPEFFFHDIAYTRGASYPFRTNTLVALMEEF